MYKTGTCAIHNRQHNAILVLHQKKIKPRPVVQLPAQFQVVYHDEMSSDYKAHTHHFDGHFKVQIQLAS